MLLTTSWRWSIGNIFRGNCQHLDPFIPRNANVIYCRRVVINMCVMGWMVHMCVLVLEIAFINSAQVKSSPDSRWNCIKWNQRPAARFDLRMRRLHDIAADKFISFQWLVCHLYRYQRPDWVLAAGDTSIVDLIYSRWVFDMINQLRRIVWSVENIFFCLLNLLMPIVHRCHRDNGDYLAVIFEFLTLSQIKRKLATF